ncbi:MAG: 16S rRNA (guanine(527)-N(7))-methyltransferase RsmG [bacterium]|nr:16S rRNA (guanine(527)-N(7))-methyltransferase RsmG [bacterium]
MTDTLAETLQKYEIELPADQIEKLDQYCKLVWEFNEQVNLTRHTNYELFVTRDVIDTLELSKLLHPQEEVLDVGTGGGVPGIPLAIIRPDLQIALAESVGKKAQMVSQIVDRLDLPIGFFQGRAEDVLEDFRYDALVARAVGPLWKILFWFKDDWHAIGRILAIKGPKWIEERNEARHRGHLQELEMRKAASYPMPGRDGESVILKIWHKNKEEPA